jgi:lysophospholipase L1-like esterase
MQRIRQICLNGGLSIGSLAVALAVAEGVVRVALPEAPTGAGPSLYRHDELLGWEKRPGATVRVRSAEWDVTVATNELGLRGPEVSPAPHSGVRVLLLGDSFVEAYTVAQEESVSAVLEQELRAAGDARAEVLNGGTAGYSTDQELLFYERDGAALRPDVVALFFYMNDLWYNTQPAYWRGAKPWFEGSDSGPVLRGVPVPRLAWASRETSDWLTARSALYRQVRELATARLRASRTGTTGATAPSEFMAWREGADPEVESAWALTESLIARLRDQVRADGGELVLFYIPSKAVVSDETWHDTVEEYSLDPASWSATADGRRLRGICDRLSIDCLDPVERFRSEAAPLGSPDALYFPVDGHWTAAGHALAASILLEWLALEPSSETRPLPSRTI